MNRRVSPPKRVTSPTWGPPPPCKQALRTCLYVVGSPGRWGDPLRWGKTTFLYMQSYNPAVLGALSQEKCWQIPVGKQAFWRLMLFYTHLLLLLQPSVLWLSIVSFNNDAKLPPKWILRESDVSRLRARLGRLPHLETFTWQNSTWAGRDTRAGRPGYPLWRVIPTIM